MRCGMTLFIQGYEDWDRYLARERGEAVPDLDPELDRQRLSGEIETALMAEDLGFDSLWTVEHHVSPYTMIPNPVQLLTFFAGATSRMDMGTMVVVLPWHHPLRVAEDITLLQYALRGRTPFIGFGRGAARREFRQLGFDMNQSKDVFAESIQVVKAALTRGGVLVPRRALRLRPGVDAPAARSTPRRSSTRSTSRGAARRPRRSARPTASSR